VDFHLPGLWKNARQSTQCGIASTQCYTAFQETNILLEVLANESHPFKIEIENLEAGREANALEAFLSAIGLDAEL